LLLLTAESGVVTDSQAQTQPPGAPSPSSSEVVGTSYILPTIGSGSTITAYASTEIGSDLQPYYEPGVDATLTQAGGSPISGTPAGTIGEETLSAPSAAALFEVDSSHYLTPTSYENCPAFADPYGFANAGAASFSGPGYIVVDAPQEEDDLNCTSYTRLDVGTTSWQEYGTAPQIQSISPNGVTLASTGTLTITGNYLTAEGTDSNPAVTVVGGTGLTTGNVTIVSDNELDVGYTVDSSPSSTGQHGITVTTIGGTSNQANVNVGDPTPSITSVSPNPWNAGTLYTCSIQIRGSGFGTNPTLTITSADGGSEISSFTTSGCAGATDGLITATVQTSASFVPGSAQITVQSNGYNGSGFLQGQTGQSSTSNQQTVTITPDAAPIPQIMFNKTNIANNANPSCPNDVACVVVGQQIALTAVFPVGNTPDSQSWDQPSGTIVGGYNIDTTTSPPETGQSVALPGTGACQTFQGACLTFYWTEAGGTAGTVTRTVKYHYSFGGQTQPDLVETFQVTAPTNVAVNAKTGLVNVTANSPLKRGIPIIVYGGASQNLGITFGATSTPPQGTIGANSEYAWVQLRGGQNQTLLTSAGPQYCRMSKFVPAAGGDATPALDTSFPYATNPPATPTVQDNPFYVLQATANGLLVGETKVSESFTMYLMWDPALPNDCSPWGVNQTTNATIQTQCTSIPIPLGTVSWSFACDAINTLAPQPQPNGTNWIAGCISPPQAGSANFNAGTSFPAWTHAVATSDSSCKATPFN